MKLIVGLGNIGKEFENTPHNVGFMALDFFIKENFENLEFKENKKLFCQICFGELVGKKVCFIKPTTMMNNSGKAVLAVMNFYKIELKDLIVLHDDYDLEFGSFKICKNRGAAGHKGVLSIFHYLGTQDFSRIRIGIHILENKMPLEKFVLNPLNTEYVEKLLKTFVLVDSELKKWILQ